MALTCSFIMSPDSEGGSDFGQVLVDVVAPAANSPTVGDLSLSTDKNTQLNINLTGISPSGSPLIFSIVDNAANGTLSNVLPINNTLQGLHILHQLTLLVMTCLLTRHLTGR